jgi:disulfide oxidoreductase YuzD
MSQPVRVQIIGAPIACTDGVKDTWRDLAHWAEGQLKARFGEDVEVKYYDLFDADCPHLPADAQLPLVLVNGEVTLNGGKIAIPVIRRKIESALEALTKPISA